MLIGCLEASEFFGSAFGLGEVNSGGVDDGRHGHHDVLELAVIDICACRPGERLTAHGCLYHLDRIVCRALEG